MTREPHFINPTTGKDYPSNLVFFDCETGFTTPQPGRQAHRMKLAVAEHWRHTASRGWKLQSELATANPAQLAEFLTRCARKKSKLYLFAHNVQFDLLVSSLFLTLPSEGWKLESFYFKGLVSIFEWRNDTRKLVALDSANFFQGKLSDIGETLGLPKIPIDFETASDAELLTYCRNDVAILRLMLFRWLEFLQDHDLGSFRNTLASTTFNAWRHRFLSHKVYIHNEPVVLELETRSYHGGRVEMFKRGRFETDTYYRLDVNAMYPSLMRDHKYPVSLYAWKHNLSVDKLQEKLEKYAVIADVTLETQEPAFPAILSDVLCYPTGTYRTTLCTPEISLLLDCGVVKRVHFAAWYQQQPIFTEYMIYLYDLRMSYRHTGNKPYEKMCKIMANAAYGKWSQRTINTIPHDGERGELAYIEHCWDCDKHEPYKIVHIAGEVFEQRPGGYSYHAFPAIASHVTAQGRILLYQYIRQAGRENVYHCDTDGLIVNSQGYARLMEHVNPDELGKLKIEEVCPWIEIHAPKHYITPTTEKRKGVRSNAREIAFDLWQQVHFAGLNTMLMRGSITEVHVDDVLKQLQYPVRTGVLAADSSVSPFHLQQP